MSKTKTTTKPEEIASVKIGTGVTIQFWFPDCATIHFKKKPEKKVINDLKAAGFVRERGSWHGRAEKIPDCVTEMIHPKTGFTPGPWTAFKYAEQGRITGIRDKFGQDVCDVFEEQTCPQYGRPGISESEKKANAELIAAAPDMYSMLLSVLDECQICDPNFTYPGDCSMRRQIEAVLKKARGEK